MSYQQCEKGCETQEQHSAHHRSELALEMERLRGKCDGVVLALETGRPDWSHEQKRFYASVQMSQTIFRLASNFNINTTCDGMIASAVEVADLLLAELERTAKK